MSTAANGLSRGCAANLDLLNMLFEAFSAWRGRAAASPLVSFADDLALVASSIEDMEKLVAAYLEWCRLLVVKVTKVPLWTRQPRC